MSGSVPSNFASTRPADRQLLYRDRVVVGPDGNGATAGRFATTVVGDQVRYVLIVAEEVCRDRGDPPAPCPPPVDSITINLNSEVVLQTPFEFERERVEVALNETAEDNSIVIAAQGQPGSVARVAVVAESPTDVLFGGLSVLPWASTTHRVRTLLAVHNAGAAERLRRVFMGTAIHQNVVSQEIACHKARVMGARVYRQV